MDLKSQKHNEHGPAVVSPEKDYMEWWNNGALVAVYMDKKLYKQLNSENSIELEVKDKWKGMESLLSLDDLKNLSLKHIHTKVNETEKKVEFINEKGEFSRNEGPAVILKDGSYMEWWKKGALVAYYENGKVFKYESKDIKNEIDMNSINKFKGKEITMSLGDIIEAPVKKEIVLNDMPTNNPAKSVQKGIFSEEVRKSIKETEELLKEQQQLIKLRDSQIDNENHKNFIEDIPQQKDTIKRIAEIRETLRNQSHNKNKLKM